MNFADIENAWRSPGNQPDPNAIEQRRQEFIAELRRRKRRQAIFLGVVFAALAAITALLAKQVVAPGPGTDPTDLRGEWSILLFFALPWIGWLFMLRLHRRHNAATTSNADIPIQESISALLDENQSERRRYVFIAILLAATAIALPLVVHQLQAVGKAGPEIEAPAYIVYPSYVALAIAWIAYRIRRSLRPRQRALESLLAQYRSTP